MNKKGLLSLCAILLALVLAMPAVPVLAENNAYVKNTDAGKINLRSGLTEEDLVPVVWFDGQVGLSYWNTRTALMLQVR